MVAWGGIMLVFAVAGIVLAMLLRMADYCRGTWAVSIGASVLLTSAIRLFDAAGLGGGHRFSELMLGVAQCISMAAILWFGCRLFLCWRRERLQKPLS